MLLNRLVWMGLAGGLLLQATELPPYLHLDVLDIKGVAAPEIATGTVPSFSFTLPQNPHIAIDPKDPTKGLTVTSSSNCAIPLVDVPVASGSYSMQKLKAPEGILDPMAIKTIPVCKR